MKFLIAFALAFTAFMTTSYAQTPPYSQQRVILKTVTITSGQTASAAIDIGGYSLVGFSLPATMTGTATSITVASTLAGTYNPLYDSGGTLYSRTTAALRYYAVSPFDSNGIRFMRVVSGSAEGADRVITLHLKSI